MNTYKLPIEILRENIRRLMAARGIQSESELARRAKMPNARTVNKILNAQDNPGLKTLMQLALGLDVAVWQLLMPQVSERREITRALQPGMDEGAQAVAAVYTQAADGVKRQILDVADYAAGREQGIVKPPLLEALRDIAS